MTDTPDNDKPTLTPVGQDVPPPPADNDPVGEAIGMEARVMLKAVRLPSTGSIPDNVARQVRETIKEHIKQYTLTYRAIGAQIGLADSTVSEVLSGKYKGDTDAVLRKLNAWVDDDEKRRRRIKPLGFYETSVFQAARDASVIAKKNARSPGASSVDDERARIVLAVGPSGCGKSVAAKALHAYDPNSILVRIRQRAGTDSGLAKLIVESAGWRGRPNKSSAIEFMVEKLRGSARLLIVDEAHRLSPSGYELLRDLADECGIPILLLGTDKIRRRVDSLRMGLGNYLDDQFNRRVCYVMDLLRGSSGKGGSTRPFFTLEEIVAIFNSDKVKLTQDGAELLCAIACTIGIGMLGMAANIYDKAIYAALRKQRTIDAALLRSAAKKVLLPAGVANPEIMRQIESTLDRNREIARRAAG